jgi:hypothetical protein
MQAIKLMCLNEGWHWTINTFLKEFVKSELSYYTEVSKSVNAEPLATQIRAKHILAFYFYLQGNIISQLSSVEKSVDTKPDAVEVIKSFSLLLNNSQNTTGSYLFSQTFLLMSKTF